MIRWLGNQMVRVACVRSLWCRKFVGGVLLLLVIQATMSEDGSAQDTLNSPMRFESQFEEAWARIEERFYDAERVGPDWLAGKAEYARRVRSASSRSEFAAIMQDLMRSLKSSHCAFWTEDDIEYYHLLDIFRAIPDIGARVTKSFPGGQLAYTGIDILPERVDGKWFIAGVLHGGVAESVGLHRGNELLRVDDEPYAPVQSFRGRAGQATRLTIRRAADAEPETITVVPHAIEPQAAMLQAMKSSMRVIATQKRRIAYVHVWSYAGKQFHELLENELLSGEMADADALVLDLRDGWGGASPAYLNLFNRNLPRLESISRDGGRFAYPTHWSKPVVLLVNGGSRSGKEVLAYAFKRYRIGPVVGSTTGGAVLAGTPILVGDDSVMYLAVNRIEVDGESLEGVGVTPDHVVEFPLPYASPEDPQLSKAIEVASGLVK